MNEKLKKFRQQIDAVDKNLLKFYLSVLKLLKRWVVIKPKIIYLPKTKKEKKKCLKQENYGQKK